MCGITGLVGEVYDRHDLEKYLKESCDQLHRRGPDQKGFSIEKGVGLGCSRLAIQDGDKGQQPMSYHGFTLVFNGEIYNKKPLQRKLELQGHVLETDCDTEVLLKALVECGDSVVSELEGMFAFALWDSTHQILTLGRDRWGEKPLYYTFDQKSFSFASEIKAFQPWPHVKWEIAEEDLLIFLKNSYLPCPRTGWKQIYKLEQGSILKLCNQRFHISRFFTPRLGNDHPEPKELFSLLQSNVKSCMASDRPLGAFLSGGLDSTSIAYFLSRENPTTPVFSLHWKETSHSEEEYTRHAAKALKLNHFSVECGSEFFKNHFDEIVDLYDEPFGDESMVPTYCLAQFAKQKVDVVLTGDGADELFHGYQRYFFDGEPGDYLETFAATSAPIMHSMARFKDLLPMKSLEINHPRNRSWVDLHSYLTDDILMKVDRACMGVSLESRTPFLTPQVSDFALRCSMESLVGNNQRGKEILRAAMQESLPKTILERKKMGFGVPLNEWFRGPLKEWMSVRLLEGELKKSTLVSMEGVSKLIDLHCARRGNFARPLFNLLVLERWLKNHIHR